jgi:hypothetical protein
VHDRANRVAAAEHALRAAVRDDVRPLGPIEDVPVGAHLVTPRRGYTHHGIYVGGGRVVHYAGLCRSLHAGPVEEVSLAEFADGRGVFVKGPAVANYCPQTIVARARSRLGEDRYRLTTNNCEHFCAWCLHGEARSEQVDRLLGWPRALAAAAGAVLRQFAAAVAPNARASA